MIDFNDITYVRLGTRNLDQAIEYATRILGLQLVRHEGRSAYFRSDSRDHTLVYFEGDPRDHTTGFEVTSSRRLESSGHPRALRPAGQRGTRQECEARYVDEFIRFRD